MKKIATPKGDRNSNIGAVGIEPPAAPGSEPSSPHGSDVRVTITSSLAVPARLARVDEGALRSWLTLRPCSPDAERWDVVRVDRVGELGLTQLTVLVHDVPVFEAVAELFSWSEGLNLPYVVQPGEAGLVSPVSELRREP